jgi:hypothetical protein
MACNNLASILQNRRGSRTARRASRNRDNIKHPLAPYGQHNNPASIINERINEQLAQIPQCEW